MIEVLSSPDKNFRQPVFTNLSLSLSITVLYAIERNRLLVELQALTDFILFFIFAIDSHIRGEVSSQNQIVLSFLETHPIGNSPPRNRGDSQSYIKNPKKNKEGGGRGEREGQISANASRNLSIIRGSGASIL